MKSDRTSRRSSARKASRSRSDTLQAALVAAIGDSGTNDERAAIRFVELLEQQLHELEQRQETIEQLLEIGEDA
ncbi:MAG: hypothetical protein H7X80_07765, partial [bacterium]|nr:hypothetical protein [Candidatus Kapabacteria bacterium]